MVHTDVATCVLTDLLVADLSCGSGMVDDLTPFGTYCVVVWAVGVMSVVAEVAYSGCSVYVANTVGGSYYVTFGVVLGPRAHNDTGAVTVRSSD